MNNNALVQEVSPLVKYQIRYLRDTEATPALPQDGANLSAAEFRSDPRLVEDVTFITKRIAEYVAALYSPTLPTSEHSQMISQLLRDNFPLWQKLHEAIVLPENITNPFLSIRLLAIKIAIISFQCPPVLTQVGAVALAQLLHSHMHAGDTLVGSAIRAASPTLLNQVIDECRAFYTNTTCKIPATLPVAGIGDVISIFTALHSELGDRFLTGENGNWILLVLTASLKHPPPHNIGLSLLAIVAAYGGSEEVRRDAATRLITPPYLPDSLYKARQVITCLDQGIVQLPRGSILAALSTFVINYEAVDFARLMESLRDKTIAHEIYADLGTPARGWFATHYLFTDRLSILTSQSSELHSLPQSTIDCIFWLQLSTIIIQHPEYSFQETCAAAKAVMQLPLPDPAELTKRVDDATLESLFDLILPSDGDQTLPEGVTINAASELHEELLRRIAASEEPKRYFPTLHKAIGISALQDDIDWRESSFEWRSPMRIALQCFLNGIFTEHSAKIVVDQLMASHPTKRKTAHIARAVRTIFKLHSVDPNIPETLTHKAGILMYGRYTFHDLLFQYTLITDSAVRLAIRETPICVFVSSDDHNQSMSKLGAWYKGDAIKYFIEVSRNSDVFKYARNFYTLFGAANAVAIHSHGTYDHLAFSNIPFSTKLILRSVVSSAIRLFLADDADVLIDSCCGANPGGVQDALGNILFSKRCRIVSGMGVSRLSSLVIETQSNRYRVSAGFIQGDSSDGRDVTRVLHSPHFGAHRRIAEEE